MQVQTRMMPFVAAAAMAVISFACGRADTDRAPRGFLAATGPEMTAAEAQITAEYLQGIIADLSSDEFEGRGPATEGDRRTRAFLVDTLKALGYEPGGPGGHWEQPFDIVGVRAAVPPAWRFEAPRRAVTLREHDDFIAASGVQADSASIEDAEVVFVGYGIQAPEYGWDDFKGADLTGKILLMLNNDPDWDPQLFEGVRRLYYGRWTYKYESAARQGAAGAIIIHTTPSAGYPWQVVQTSWSGDQFELPADGGARIQVAAWSTEDAARRLVAAAGRNLEDLVASARTHEFRPVPLGIRTSLTLTNRLSRVQTANVAGLLRGSDPALAGEVVVFTAHHDHLGIGEPDASGDRIYNGALDNASGCAQLLAIARAFAALPERPRRSILMLFVAAEEQGLLGSQHFARQPTFPPGKIAANLNFDGANIWGRTGDVTLLGLGKSSLDEVAHEAVARQGRTLQPDQFPDRGSYYRSDQFSFAQIGVPALYYRAGTQFVGRPAGWGRAQVEAWEANRYHQPSDEIDETWTFDGMVDDARLGFHSGLLVAQADAMPAWRPGDEFEAARKAAIAAAP
jgi:Zn-dependent M28 family amino/carboxypeptidase